MALICRFQRVPPTEESSRCCSCIRQREGRPTCWKPGSKSPNFHFSLRACSQQFLRLPEIFPSEPRPAPFVEAWLARAGSRPCAPSPSILLRTADILPTVPYRKTLPALQTRRRHQRSDQNRRLLKIEIRRGSQKAQQTPLTLPKGEPKLTHRLCACFSALWPSRRRGRRMRRFFNRNS